MGNSNSSMQELNGSRSRTNSRKNSSATIPTNKESVHSSISLTHADSTPAIIQPSSTKPYNIQRVKQQNSQYGESPFVGSPLTQADELPSQLNSKNTSSSSNSSNKAYNSQPITYKRDPIKDLPQPDSFPSSLPDTLSRRTSLSVEQSKLKKEIKNNEGKEDISTLISWNLPAKNVYVTGTFNGWKHKIPLNKCNNEFSTVINFPIGIHHIKFIVDDEWKCSNELLTCTDQDGNLVNYIEVDENLLRLDQSSNTQDILSSSPTGEYTNEIPEFNINKPTSDNPLRPPTLPPHLEKVILNASLPDAQINQDESWLLPVPNHVVLNHLYACSIRDGVMAVAGTTRYHKKYVTTIYYKPVII